MNTSSNWRQAANLKLRRLQTEAEQARQAYLAANAAASAIIPDIRKLEEYRDELKNGEIADPKRLAETLLEIDTLNAALTEAREFASEIAAKNTGLVDLAYRSGKAMEAVEALDSLSSIGG